MNVFKSLSLKVFDRIIDVFNLQLSSIDQMLTYETVDARLSDLAS